MAGNLNMSLLILQIFMLFCLVASRSQIDKDYEEAEKLGKCKVHLLQRGKPIKGPSPKPVDLDIFCFKGLSSKTLFKIWTSATVKVTIAGDYSLYTGSNASHVYQQYAELSRSWYHFVPLPWRSGDQVPVAVFNKTCLAVHTSEAYTVDFLIKNVDVTLAALTIGGLILFLSARPLSRNVLFYYGTGISFGILASLLILVYVLSKFMPRKYGALAIIAGGWSVFLYLLQYMWENVQLLMEAYIWYFVAYCTTASVISFAYLYYRGPVSSPRSLELIKWSIMGTGLLCVYQGCQIREVAAAIIVLLLVSHNFPRSLLRWLSRLWRRRFPTTRRLLTEEEYLRQANEETKKALEELRSFCRSPDCDAWKTISRLSSPNKFAGWVEGDSHLSEDEILSYDSDGHLPPEYHTDNESEISFSLHSQ